MADKSSKRPTGSNGLDYPGETGKRGKSPVGGNGHAEHSAGDALAVGRTDAAPDAALSQPDQTWFRMLFEEAPDAIFLETLDDRIVDANKEATRLLGYQREEFLKMTIADPRVQ